MAEDDNQMASGKVVDVDSQSALPNTNSSNSPSTAKISAAIIGRGMHVRDRPLALCTSPNHPPHPDPPRLGRCWPIHSQRIPSCVPGARVLVHVYLGQAGTFSCRRGTQFRPTPGLWAGQSCRRELFCDSFPGLEALPYPIWLMAGRRSVVARRSIKTTTISTISTTYMYFRHC